MATKETATIPSREFDNVVHPLRRPGRWASTVVIVFLLVAFVQAIATNKNIDFPTIGEFMFHPRILSGVQLTLIITVISMVAAAILAVIIAAMRMSGNPVLVVVAAVYVWAFRGTPLLVQIVIWGYFGLIFDKITVGIPFTDIVFWQEDTNKLLTALVAGIIALTLNEAAYSSEIVRSGMLSVDEGQREAAASLGMSPAYCFHANIAASGDAGHHSSDGQPVDLDDQEHLTAFAHRSSGAVHASHPDFGAELAPGRAAHCGEYLVSSHCVDPVGTAALSRATLWPRKHEEPASDTHGSSTGVHGLDSNSAGTQT